jgi:predicted ATPase
MYKLLDVEITGFWGQHKIKTVFHDDVNIFIGRNGTGKTTFMNILQAVLSVDLEGLSNLQFDHVSIRLKKGSSTKKIQVHKNPDDLLEYKSLTYQISRNKYVFPILSGDLHYDRYRNGRIHPRLQRELESLKFEMDKMIGLSFLSVNREENIDPDEYRRKREPILNSVDFKLMKLMNDFTTYQLQLETEISNLSTKFQKDVLISMLFNPEFDNVPINKKVDLDEVGIEDIKTRLQQAYRDLGILDKKILDGINKHVESISNAADAINKSVENPGEPVYVHHVTPLTLLRRTRKIIGLSSQLQEDKQRVFKPILDYLHLLKEFIEGKSFKTSNKNHGGLIVHKLNEEFPLNQLSSGEKQLIILLTEALLQKQNSTIFLADEPELSLHISWQRKILPSLNELNPNAQIIVATHSPEIVGKWINNAINMENIIYG